MPSVEGPRAISLAIRCYSKSWRARHGREATELAVLLAEDGVAPSSLAWDIFKGSLRDRLSRLGVARRLAAGLAAVVAVASFGGAALAMSLPSAPAGASSFAHTTLDRPARSLPTTTCPSSATRRPASVPRPSVATGARTPAPVLQTSPSTSKGARCAPERSR
jgi:hypothetical protein